MWTPCAWLKLIGCLHAQPHFSSPGPRRTFPVLLVFSSSLALFRGGISVLAMALAPTFSILYLWRLWHEEAELNISRLRTIWEVVFQTLVLVLRSVRRLVNVVRIGRPSVWSCLGLTPSFNSWSVKRRSSLLRAYSHKMCLSLHHISTGFASAFIYQTPMERKPELPSREGLSWWDLQGGGIRDVCSFNIALENGSQYQEWKSHFLGNIGVTNGYLLLLPASQRMMGAEEKSIARKSTDAKAEYFLFGQNKGWY